MLSQLPPSGVCVEQQYCTVTVPQCLNCVQAEKHVDLVPRRSYQRTRFSFCIASIGEGAGDSAAIQAPDAPGGAVSISCAWPQEWPPAKSSVHCNAIVVCTSAHM